MQVQTTIDHSFLCIVRTTGGHAINNSALNKI
jgi:hypothetical protein